MAAAALAGAVQGIAESLPISSSAHLALLRWHLGEDLDAADAKAVDVALHVGSLAGSLVSLRGQGIRLPSLVAATIASAPAAVIGASLRSPITRRFGRPWPTAVLGATAAFAVWLADRRSGAGQPRRLEDLSLSDLMIVGAAQSAALVPGVSRSGAVYAAARSRGLDPDSAATAAITMAVPVIVGAGALMALRERPAISTRVPALAVGAGVAGIAAAATAPLTRPALTRGSLVLVGYRAALAAAVAARSARVSTRSKVAS